MPQTNKLVALRKAEEKSFLVDMFHFLNGSGIRYCVLRNCEGLPWDLLGSDLDLLVDPVDQCKVVEALRRLVKKHRAYATIFKKSEGLLAIYIFGTNSQKISWGVPIHLNVSLRWRGLTYYNVNDVLTRAVSQHGVMAADTIDTNMIGVLKELIINSRLRGNYLENIIGEYKLGPVRIERELLSLFGNRGKLLICMLRNENCKSLKHIAKKLRRALLWRHLPESPAFVLRNNFDNLLIHFRRLFNRPGIFVTILGLDGAGKSTLIEAVRPDIENLLHVETRHYHLRPHLFPSLAKMTGREDDSISVVQNPHSKPPSGLLLSILRLIYYTFDYIIGFWVVLYPQLLQRPNVVFFDRYFYEYFVDPSRLRVNIPELVVKIISNIIPKPDLVIILKADPKLLCNRKPELPLSELSLQSQRMDNLARTLDNVVWIDTSCEIETSRIEMVRVVLETFTLEFDQEEDKIKG